MGLAIRVALSAAMGLMLFAATAFAQTTGFVYAMVNNNAAENMIYGFSLDTTTGALTPLPGFPVATGGTGAAGLTTSEALVYDPAQSRLYATNVNNRVSMFAVDRATGAITALPFSPFFIQGALHGCMAVSPDGSILVGADLLSPFVDSLRIGTSSVTPAPNSPFSTGSPSFSCAFRRDGGAVYTGGNTPFISGWTVSPTTGELTPMPGSPFATPVIATGYATDTLNRLFTVSFTDGAVRAHSIENGAPALLGSPTPSSQTGQIQGVMHPFGYYLATARNSNDVAVFRISGLGAGTTLTQVPGSPFATGGTFSNASIVDPSGQVVITANGSSRNLTTFRFDSGTGAMTPALLQPANTMGATGGIVGLAFARQVGGTPPPGPAPAPPPPPPTISSIPNQSMLQSTTISVPFTIAGGVLVSALRVSIASSNTTLLPVSPSALSTSCNASGACTLRITPADGRAGTSTITLTVSDGTSAASTSFVVTVTAVRPTAPAVVLANTLGSGFVVTWSPPDTGTPMAYAVSWGTNATASNLPVQLVPGTTPRFEVAAVPNGTYFFRIYAVGTGDLSPPSPLGSVAVTAGASVPGPPLALRTTASTNSILSNWVAPTLGAAATIYEVHVGTGFGMNDVASATTAGTTHTASSLAAGSYWVRTRAASGGLAGAWSSSVQIPVAPAPCTGAPGTPILLPVTTTPGQVTFTWIAMGNTAATFDAQISFGAGLPPVGTLSTTGAGTSLVWNQMSGTFAARLGANNPCGASARSNEMSFSIQ